MTILLLSIALAFNMLAVFFLLICLSYYQKKLEQTEKTISGAKSVSKYFGWNYEKMKACPCKNCTDRHVACHDKCKKYHAWRYKHYGV